MDRRFRGAVGRRFAVARLTFLASIIGFCQLYGLVLGLILLANLAAPLVTTGPYLIWERGALGVFGAAYTTLALWSYAVPERGGTVTLLVVLAGTNLVTAVRGGNVISVAFWALVVAVAAVEMHRRLRGG